jgi:hypothetical protein
VAEGVHECRFSAAASDNQCTTAPPALQAPSPEVPCNSQAPGTQVLIPSDSQAPGTQVLFPADSQAPGTQVLIPSDSQAPGTQVLIPSDSQAPGTQVLFPADSQSPGTQVLIPSDSQAPEPQVLLPSDSQAHSAEVLPPSTLQSQITHRSLYYPSIGIRARTDTMQEHMQNEAALHSMLTIASGTGCCPTVVLRCHETFTIAVLWRSTQWRSHQLLLQRYGFKHHTHGGPHEVPPGLPVETANTSLHLVVSCSPQLEAHRTGCGASLLTSVSAASGLPQTSACEAIVPTQCHLRQNICHCHFNRVMIAITSWLMWKAPLKGPIPPSHALQTTVAPEAAAEEQEDLCRLLPTVQAQFPPIHTTTLAQSHIASAGTL